VGEILIPSNMQIVKKIKIYFFNVWKKEREREMDKHIEKCLFDFANLQINFSIEEKYICLKIMLRSNEFCILNTAIQHTEMRKLLG
jgi:hypothetical protein